jgi:hypothetical protein
MGTAVGVLLLPIYPNDGTGKVEEPAQAHMTGSRMQTGLQ